MVIKSLEQVQTILPQVFSQATLAFCLLEGREFNTAYINDIFLNIIDRTSEQVTDKLFFDVVDEVVEQGFKEIAQQVFDTGIPYKADEIPIDLLRKGKMERIYSRIHILPIKDEDGKVSYVVIMGDDVTKSRLDLRTAEINERRNQLALEGGDIGSFEYCRSDGHFVYSEFLNTIFGFELGSKHSFDEFINCIIPEDLPIRNKATEESIHTGKLFYEIRINKANGQQAWLRCRGIVFAEDDGRIVVYGLVTDFTREKHLSIELDDLILKHHKNIDRKNKQLADSELRFQRITEEVEDYSIIVLDINGHILNWNRGAEKIKGFQENEIIGKHFRIFYTNIDKDNKLPEMLLQRAFFQGRSSIEGFRIRKDGSSFWANSVISAIHNSEGSVIGYTKLTRDLTERKIAEDKLKKYTTELEFQNKELEQFAYIASHDLQEPLRKIRLFAGMLESNLEHRESAERYLGKIESSAKRMSDLIQSVLNYRRLIHQSELNQKRVQLNSVVSELLADFDLLIEEKGAMVQVKDLPMILGNEFQMHQLFYNLIGNALKFSPENPSVEIFGQINSNIPDETRKQFQLEDEAYYEICVRDNGIGFEQKYAEQIFTIFKRLNNISDYQGTGIGLALCKKIIDNHKGGIRATSEPGKGTTFYVYLPLERITNS